MMLEKCFELKSNDLMVVPIPIRKKINALKWDDFIMLVHFPMMN
ncbi:hypothetical protein Gotur_033945 [Gossypium turneri]